MDSELNVLRWHRTVRLATSPPETSTTLLQEAVGCNRTKQSQSHRANIQHQPSVVVGTCRRISTTNSKKKKSENNCTMTCYGSPAMSLWYKPLSLLRVGENLHILFTAQHKEKNSAGLCQQQPQLWKLNYPQRCCVCNWTKNCSKTCTQVWKTHPHTTILP